MKRYQKILVCIEKPERDCRLLDYVGAICRLAETKEIHLLHVASGKQSKPDEAALDKMEPYDVTPDTLRILAEEHLKGHGNEEVICQVITDTPLIGILRYGLENDIDLIIIGRHASGGQRRGQETVLSRRLTRKATCSVLVLPRDARTKADKILVPVRDSPCSANAVDSACAISRAIDSVVCCLNVFHVGSGYSKVGSTLEEHMALLQKHAKHECERLLIGVETGGANVVTKCVPDLYSQPASIILNEIENESADLVVIGARGRTGAAGVLLGKVTAKLIRQSPIPVLAVKKKGECIGILRALLIMASGEE
ncbi:MAG: universal stress protein [Planctomycetota bacterium]|nr:MAG: universal stress protein [Planctomycetota bacterium]